MVSLDDFEYKYIDYGTELTPSGSSSSDDSKKKTFKPSIQSSDAYRIPNEQLLLLFHHVSIVFPAVFRAISETDEKQPLIVVRPSFASFEQLFANLHPNFLAPSSTPSEQNWLRRLRSRSHSDQVRLYNIFLARMEQAILDSHSSDQHQRNQALASRKDSKQDATSRQILFLLSDVFSHRCVAGSDQFTSKGSSILKPILEACLIRNEATPVPRTNQVDSALLTPMSWLVAKSRHLSLKDVDQAVGKAMKTIREEEEAASTPASLRQGETVPNKEGESSAPSGKKKKRKNKKKKVRRSRSIGCISLGERKSPLRRR